MKIVILVLAFSFNAFADKTISVTAPNCNYNVSVQAPASECCCPTMVAPTSAPGGGGGSGGIGGNPGVYCYTTLSHSSPTCVVADSVKFRGLTCSTYLTCTGRNTYTTGSCPGQVFSYLQQKCVDKVNNCCPL